MKAFLALLLLTFQVPVVAKTLIIFNLDRLNNEQTPDAFKENNYLDKIIQEFQEDTLNQNDQMELIYFSASRNLIKTSSNWSEINGPETMNAFMIDSPNTESESLLSLKEKYFSTILKKYASVPLEIYFFGEVHGQDDLLSQIIKENYPNIVLTSFIKDNHFKLFAHHPSFELGGIKGVSYYNSLADLITNPKLNFLSQKLLEDILYDFQNDSIFNQEKKQTLKALIRHRVGKYICSNEKSFGYKRRNCFKNQNAISKAIWLQYKNSLKYNVKHR